MSVILVFMAALAAIIIWWMAKQRLLSKPWLEVGTAADTSFANRSPAPTAKIGLGVFLAVVGALFSLFISAYFMRMQGSDWWSLPMPRLLWVNTGVLAASSAALHWASVDAKRGRDDLMRISLLAAFTLGIVFLVGQILAWRQLVSEGYVLADNPANSFFYLITGMHGLHILGGLFALGRTIRRSIGGTSAAKTHLGVELCAIYWHFMLLVWLVLFAFFGGWANNLIDICRQLLT
ncbi:cytochrome c oxidase subunit 3 [Rhizobium sp. BK251]|uniref:cytochrome c oxidase subunit 3 n=1 Tax=Rhizobium sp. BK251 TaxID=2512125 RepID=UPI001046B0EC|nr:cytochrome c oxidase subunit 3 [Rhizobium sp. BK251]TCL65206.1 cytochrome c oxidase subunit 3 [Rhizobium sp. BK251]